jgi:7-cyano-7-deazaguanine synthase
MTNLPANRAVVLLSGGVDSATTAAVAQKEGYQLYALSFDYGQRHRVELRSARRVAESLQTKEHLTVKLDLNVIGGSALTDSIPVPKDGVSDDTHIPITYVPARNTIFLSVALGWAEVLNAKAIFIGANAVDYSGYPDCRPEYLDAFAKMANLATRRGVEGNPIEIKAPLLYLSKREIVLLGTELGVDYSLTSSCYDPGETGNPCGECDSCRFRQKGFADAGLEDPILQPAGRHVS